MTYFLSIIVVTKTKFALLMWLLDRVTAWEGEPITDRSVVSQHPD
jgi:hypothetical protein